jgi:hypothetical protein
MRLGLGNTTYENRCGKEHQKDPKPTLGKNEVPQDTFTLLREAKGSGGYMWQVSGGRVRLPTAWLQVTSPLSESPSTLHACTGLKSQPGHGCHG